MKTVQSNTCERIKFVQIVVAKNDDTKKVELQLFRT